MRSVDHEEHEDENVLDFIFLDKVEEINESNTSEEEYFSCSEKIEEIKSKRKTRRRGKRKPQNNNKDEEIMMVDKEREDNLNLSWEVHMPGIMGD